MRQRAESSIHQAEPAVPEEAAPGDLAELSQPSQPLEETPPRPAAKSAESSPASAERKSTRKMFLNLMLAVYTVMKQCLSSAMFDTLLIFGQKCGGLLPDSHQSTTVFEECRDLICTFVQQLLLAEITQSPYWALSIDEKDAMLVILMTFITSQGKKVTAPLAYKPLPGLEASDLFRVILSTIQNFGLDKEKLIAFTADGQVSWGPGEQCLIAVVTMLPAACKHSVTAHSLSNTVPRISCSWRSGRHSTRMSIYFKQMEKRTKPYSPTCLDLRQPTSTLCCGPK